MTFEEVQRAVFDLLVTDAEVAGELADQRDLNGSAVPGVPAIYDHVPQPGDGSDDSWFPYLTIGEIEFTEWDTDDSLGFDAEVTVHVWSREFGRQEARRIQGKVYSALHRSDLAVDDHNVITVDQAFCEVTVDPDGKTRHGIQRFRVILERVEGE